MPKKKQQKRPSSVKVETDSPKKKLKPKATADSVSKNYGNETNSKKKFGRKKSTKTTDNPTSEPVVEPNLSDKSNQSDSKKTNKLVLCPKARLQFSFYDVPCLDLAKALLGTRLVRRVAGKTLSGVIVETEAYTGGEDKASHSYNGKQTDKNRAMYMPPGTAYVYHIYGSNTCMNVSSRGDGAAVLIRALDPDPESMDTMRTLRAAKRPEKAKTFKDKVISNGPSKLTMALGIDKASVNQKDLMTTSDIWLQESDTPVLKEFIVVTSRIGVDYAEEWASKPFRFYLRGNGNVSVRDKAAEAKLMND